MWLQKQAEWDEERLVLTQKLEEAESRTHDPSHLTAELEQDLTESRAQLERAMTEARHMEEQNFALERELKKLQSECLFPSLMFKACCQVRIAAKLNLHL